MRIDIRQCDGWIAVYKDGEKVEENHSCSLVRGLEALEIPFTRVEVTADEMERWLLGPRWATDSDPFPEHL